MASSLRGTPSALVLAVVFASLPARAAEPARRVVSLNPSLTAILLAIGARDVLVGVDDFSARQEPAAAGLPTVGGLYNPSLEAVVALEPDLVAFVPAAEQRDFQRRLEELRVPALALDPVSFEDVLATIATLGSRTGRASEARARIEAIRAKRAEVERAAAAPGRPPPPRLVLVLQRDPLFVIGRGSFVDEMLAAVGAENLGRAFAEPYPRATREWLIAARPELILDASGEPEASAEPEDALAFWSRWPSLPAVAARRVVAVPPGLVTLPGPWLDRALGHLARIVEAEGEARRPRGATRDAGAPRRGLGDDDGGRASPEAGP